MGNLIKLRDEISDKCKNNINSPYLEKLYSIDAFFECERGETYKKAIKFCEDKGYKRAFDIGCAHGIQSEVFIESKLNYIGVNDGKLDFHNKEFFDYIEKPYPFSIKTKEGDIAISLLCLGWNCYLYEGENTLNEQFRVLSQDFNSCILDVPNDKFKTITKYFPHMENIEKGLNYFYK